MKIRAWDWGSGKDFSVGVVMEKLEDGTIRVEEVLRMHYCPDCETQCYCREGQSEILNCIHCEENYEQKEDKREK